MTAISVVPDSKRYAVGKGWVDEGSAFDPREVVSDRHRRVTELAPGVSFRAERIDAAASAGVIAKRIRDRAVVADASVVFIGSENAERIVVSVSSMGGSIAADRDYDVHVVRKADATRIERLRAKLGFYR